MYFTLAKHSPTFSHLKNAAALLQKISPSYYFTILSMTTVMQEQLYRHMKCLQLLSETFPVITPSSEHSSKSSRLPGTPNPSHCVSVPSLHHTFALLETYNTKRDAQASRGLLPRVRAAVTLASQVDISPCVAH